MSVLCGERTSVAMSAWSAAQLLDPKAAAKEKARKRVTNYGTFTCVLHIVVE